jgi:hypothetical protein
VRGVGRRSIRSVPGEADGSRRRGAGAPLERENFVCICFFDTRFPSFIFSFDSKDRRTIPFGFSSVFNVAQWAGEPVAANQDRALPALLARLAVWRLGARASYLSVATDVGLPMRVSILLNEKMRYRICFYNMIKNLWRNSGTRNFI